MDDDMDTAGRVEPSYEHRRDSELGGPGDGNPFAAHVTKPYPSSEPGRGGTAADGNAGDRDETVEDAGSEDDGAGTPEAEGEAHGRGDSDAGAERGLEERMTSERDQGMMQMWLILGVSLLVAAMSPILLTFLTLMLGARVGIIWFMVVESFVPVITSVVALVEMATRPALRAGAAGRASLIIAVLVIIVEALVIIVFARFGGEVMASYEAVVKGLPIVD